MGENSFLQDLVVTLVAALLVIVPSRRFKIPAAVGFMLTGILIGPGGLKLITDTHHVETLAEVGVAMLLFMIGLEFSLARLKEIGRAFLGSVSRMIAGATTDTFYLEPGSPAAGQSLATLDLRAGPARPSSRSCGRENTT